MGFPSSPNIMIIVLNRIIVGTFWEAIQYSAIALNVEKAWSSLSAYQSMVVRYACETSDHNVHHSNKSHKEERAASRSWPRCYAHHRGCCETLGRRHLWS